MVPGGRGVRHPDGGCHGPASAGGAGRLLFGEAVCDPALPFERVSVAEAVAAYAGSTFWRRWGRGAAVDRDALAAQMVARGMRVAADDTWSDMLSAILVTRVEPRLGMERVTMLDRYPAAEAALARGGGRMTTGWRTVRGLCLWRGTGQRVWRTDGCGRTAAAVSVRDGREARVYGERYPIDEDFLARSRSCRRQADCDGGSTVW